MTETGAKSDVEKTFTECMGFLQSISDFTYVIMYSGPRADCSIG